MADKYKIGETFTVQSDYEGTLALSETKKTVRKGSKIIIGADRLAHHVNDGMIQPLAEDAEVKGYDAKGLSEYILLCLTAHYPIDEVLEEYDISKDDVIERLEYAFCELGMC